MALLLALAACAGPLEDPTSFADGGVSGGAGASGSGNGGTGGDGGTGGGGGGASAGASGADPGKGQMVYVANTCAGCHKKDLSGGGIPGAANLTPDPDHGLGAWTDAEIRTVLLTGVKKDGTKVCPSMAQYTSLSDGDLGDLIAYMRSVPISANAPAACK